MVPPELYNIVMWAGKAVGNLFFYCCKK